MPVYEYRCSDCGTTFDALVRAGRSVTCPRCGSSSLDKLLSTPAVLSGQTARTEGQTCCGRDDRCGVPPCSAGRTCRRT
jgi:putative FmdB family regulatory protein